MLNCKSDLIPLTSSPVTYLVCAIKCEQEPDCTAFMFTRSTSSDQDAACSWCPANDIVGINYTPADPLLETWTKILGYVTFPNNPYIREPIPTTLSVGRIVIFQARVPDPVPKRCVFSLQVDKIQNVAVNVAARFNFDGDQERVVIATQKAWEWQLAYSPEGFFPFSPGQQIEFAILGRSEGFDVYINGIYIRTVTRTAIWVGQINLVEIKNFEEVLITI
ncbi:galectin [Plakobranchus ocellatus]|uniref:Galectin n=1 Tax=Plakobranchus ocellatus TaxID=259542 RepID=A0AAV4C1X8_9GAST|nr:galectin [Plakobranchus ocellatus]